MLKELLLDIYRFFNPKAYSYEHLGHIASSVLKSSPERNLLAGIYTTGLYSTSLFSDHVEIQNIEKNSSTLSKGETPNDINEDRPLADNLLAEDRIGIDSPSDFIIDTLSKVDKTTLPETFQDNEISTDSIDQTETNLEADNPVIYEHDEEIFKDTIDTFPLKTTTEKIEVPAQLSEVIWEEVIDPLIDVIETPALETHLEHKKSKKSKKKTSDSHLVKKNKKKSNKKPDFQYSDFSRWLSDLVPLSESNTEELASKPKKKKKKKKGKKKLSKVELSAKQSITLTDDIASETLATILASQGHIEEAIDMYYKLIIMFPEKAASLNIKIDELRS